MEPEELNLAKTIGKIVNDKMKCPKCNTEQNYIQVLCATGDFENYLFCPHCEFEFEIVVNIKKGWREGGN